MALVNLTDVLNGEDKITLELMQAIFQNKVIDNINNYVGANHIHYSSRNSSGATLLAGTVVTAQGTQSGTDYLEIVGLTDPQTQVAVGILHSDLANNDVGLVINTGIMKDHVDTSAWPEGTILYPNNTGGFTSTKPTSGQYQACAVVTRSHANQGTLLVEFSEPKMFSSTTQAGYVQLVNDLLTDDTTKALTASQGKWLYDNLFAKIGVANGIAPLDVAGLIDPSYLPSYVDDVIEVATHADLPVTGATGKIYVVVADETQGGDTSQYRWTGSVYALVSNTLTATDILNLLLTVDSDTSGLNANTLQGLLASQFLRSDASDTMVGDLTMTRVTGNATMTAESQNSSNVYYDLKQGANVTGRLMVDSTGAMALIKYNLTTGVEESRLDLKADGSVTVNNETVYHTGNDTNIAFLNLANIYTAPQRITVEAGSNALDFSGTGELDLTATVGLITVGTMASKKWLKGTITMRSAENVTGWGSQFRFAPDFSAVTPTPPTNMTGTMKFWYEIIEVNGVDGGTQDIIYVAWAQ